jgi:hypothetical protein
MIQNFGFSTRSAAFILYGVCCLCASFALLENFSTKLLSWIILGVFLACVVAGINRLGYIEFIAAGRTLSAKFMRRAVMDEIYLEELSRALQKADTLDQWWEVVRRACSDLRFASAHLEVQGQTYFEQFVATPQRASCRIQVGFGDFGHLHLTRIPEQTPPRLMMAVLDMLQTSIEEREFIMADSEIATIASNAA